MSDPPVKVDFIVFASQKSASTWFCRCLDEHPRISIGEPYEKRFLREEEGWVNREPNPHFLDDWEWYRNRFPSKAPDQLRGDGDVELYYNDSGPAVVEEWYPDAKLLAILRDPVKRIHSEWVHRVRNPEVPSETLEEFIETGHTLDRSRYAKQLDPWFETFPRDQIQVLTWTDLGEEGAAIVRDAFEFLDVDADFQPPSLTEKVNPHREKKAWFRGLEWTARKLRSAGLGVLMDAVNEARIGPALRSVSEEPADKPPLPAQIEKQLRRELRPEIERLGERLDRDLSRWKASSSTED